MADDDDESGSNMTNLRVRFDPDDWQLLCDVAATEKLTKTEIVRRALRAYAPAAMRQARRRQQALEAMKPEDG